MRYESARYTRSDVKMEDVKMEIKIIGSGCPTCESLYNKVMKLKEKGLLDADIKYIKNVNELISRGIMGSPALLVDNTPVYIGMPENDEELLKIIKKHSSSVLKNDQ